MRRRRLKSPRDTATQPRRLAASDVASEWRAPAAPFGTDPAGVQAMLAAIVESSDDAIVSKDLDSTIMTWNGGAERIFGYTRDETIGRSITMLLPPEHLHEEDHILATLRRGERIDHFETVRVGKDARRVDVSISVSPIRDAMGSIVGAAKIARDITERKKIETERARLLASERAARAEAEGANRAKDEFLSVVSHELRTPLASMLGWIRVLRMGKEEHAVRALNTLERSIGVQRKLIEDLVDVSRIVTGRLRLELRRIDLRSIVHATVEAMAVEATTKGVQLGAVLGDLPAEVQGDPERLEQVVLNLLSNAVKFTPSGGRVLVRLEAADLEARVTVEDTGQGLTAEFLPHLFERFRQAESVAARGRESGGLGIGLAIARNLVELHGGTIRAKSAGENKGAVFTVTLPLAPITTPAPDTDKGEAANPGELDVPRTVR
jgi:PAS domain S-box-containing protein